MRNIFRKLFTAPAFEDEEKTRIAGLLNSILLFVIIGTTLALPAMAASTEAVNLLPLFLLVVPFILLNVAAYLLMRRGNVSLASTVFLAGTGLGIFSSYIFSGAQSPGALLSITILIAFTTLLLNSRAIVGLVVLTIAVTFITTVAQSRGWITPIFVADTNPISNWITTSFIFLLTGLGLFLSSVSLRRALENARASRQSLQASNQELDQLRKALELRVEERTSELEKRATQLQIVSKVARAITSVQDMDTLLPDITKLVSEQFGLYHAGIFLLDEKNENAVLRASNSEGGQRMLERQHQLKMDTNSIVGFVTSRGESRVAMDVGTDSVYFNNPDLPETRSEMALPLRVGGRVIGALDVQSTQPNAFAEEDIATLTTLADQVAIAIENTRLFSETKQALIESERTFERYVKQEWVGFSSQAKNTAYRFDGKRTMPLDAKEKREKFKAIMQTGRLARENGSAEITIPIKLRGQAIGALDVKPKSGSRRWTQDDITLLEAVAERAALALENARLLESAQRRASRERTIGEISSKIGAVSDLDAILQAAVEELGRKIGGAAEVTIELGDEDKQRL